MLADAMLAAFRANVGVRALLGDPARVTKISAPSPAYPYLEIGRHLSEPRERR